MQTLNLPANLISDNTLVLGHLYSTFHSLLWFLPSHPSAPLCLLFVSFLLSYHWPIFRAETSGRVWICFFLETSGQPCSRDPFTFSFKSCLFTFALWAASSSSSSSASYIPNCLSLPQWPRCRYRSKKEQRCCSCLVRIEWLIHANIQACVFPAGCYGLTSNAWSLLCFSLISEFKRQLSTLSEEDNQCTKPTSECEYKMQYSRVNDTYIQWLHY